MIDGTGDGPINQRSLQIPALIKLSLHEKQGLVLGEGKGIWAFVHIADVAAFYGLLVRKLLSGETINHGRNGYHFLEAGETTWLRISQCIAEAGHALGLFFSAEVKSISPEDMKKALDIPFLNAWMVEVIWGSK
jgi:nucleoside-diphosphate-sugar epimerase